MRTQTNPERLERRILPMKKIKILTVLSIILFIGILPAYGQQKKQPPQYRQEPAPVSVHKISKHVYEVRGGAGAN